jgi:hypothetical protein
LEIAPGNEVEDLSLIADVGNAWNHIPQAREWTPLDPKCAPSCRWQHVHDTCPAQHGTWQLAYVSVLVQEERHER